VKSTLTVALPSVLIFWIVASPGVAGHDPEGGPSSAIASEPMS
jgi:hypothetical protein